MLEMLLAWVALLALLLAFAIGKPHRGGVLTLSYFLGVSLIHIPGALAYFGDTPMPYADETRIGLQRTILGLASFTFAAVMTRRLAGKSPPRPNPRRVREPPASLNRWGQILLFVGVISYFVLVPISTLVPSVTSLVASLGATLVVGIWLQLYSASISRNRRRTITILCLLPLLPLATVALFGFLGLGMYWVLSALAFQFIVARRRLGVYVSAPIVVFLGLSIFVTYMGQRNAIREVTWDEQAGLLARLDRVGNLVTDFEWLDLASPSQEAALSGRLNQNWLVGVGVLRHEGGIADFAYGATVPLWALIPRAIWPDKPAVGGSGHVVSNFTGIDFAHGTSVGVGQVLEFYINLGVPGVILGFLALGFVLMRLDIGIMEALASADGKRLIACALPGLAIVNPEGSLLEIAVGVPAAILVARLLLPALVKGRRRQPLEARRTAQPGPVPRLSRIR
jgi:hypothetical protein